MRDLPTSVWAGHGWAFDENGLRRLSSSGGSHAMQGVEVFESVGAAAEEVKPSDEKIKEAPICSCSCGASSPTLPRGRSQAHFKENQCGRSKVGCRMFQMGTPCMCMVRSIFPTIDSKENDIGRNKSSQFSVKNFIGPGISEAQADAAALEAAKAFRAELVEKGILSEPKPRDPNFTSEVPGVKWYKNQQKWRVVSPRRAARRRFTAATSPRRRRPRPRPWSSWRRPACSAR